MAERNVFQTMDYNYFKKIVYMYNYSLWYNHGFRPEAENLDFGKTLSSERAPQEEQNGANFSFIAPSMASEEL